MKHFQLQPADGRPCFGSTLLRAQVSLLHRHQFSSFSCRIVWIKCFGVLTVHDKTFRDNPLPNPAVWSLGPRLEKPKWGGGAPAFFSCFSGPVVHSLGDCCNLLVCISRPRASRLFYRERKPSIHAQDAHHVARNDDLFSTENARPDTHNSTRAFLSPMLVKKIKQTMTVMTLAA